MPDRVAIVIDYQNVYMWARHTFEFDPETASHWMGQFNPYLLGRELTARRPGRELSTVRVYRGLPDAHRDPKGHGACQRQLDSWAKLPSVTPLPRPLRYPMHWPDEKAREKGIDVQLAVDFLMMAVSNKFDVGIIFSQDTDLRPALEAVEKLRGPDSIEVAAWQPDMGHASRLWIGKGHPKRPWCHYLDRTVDEGVLDVTDYNVPTKK
jgi:hypothetical protein